MEGAVSEKLNTIIKPITRLWPYQLVRWLLLGFLLGIVFLSGFVLNWLQILFGVLLWLVTGKFLKIFDKKYYWLLGGLLLACLRLAVFNPVASVDLDKELIFEAAIVKLPRFKNSYKTYSLKTKTGREITVITRFYPEYYYGDFVKVICPKFLKQSSFYKNQPVKLICLWPDLSLIKRPDSGWVYQLYLWRSKLAERLQVVLSEPYASLTSGMLWGDDSGLSDDVREYFKKTGTTHLLAVSGYNLMVLTSLLFWLLIGCGLNRYKSGGLMFLIIIIFVIFTGAEAATVRAGFMAIATIIAYSLSRRPNKLNWFLLTAGLMLLYQPAYLYDLGWQLSFAALFGLTWLSPWLREKLFFITERFGLRSAAADTLSANFTTLPLILIQLKQLSLISPLSNLLIGPVVVLVFILGLFLLILPAWLFWLKAVTSVILQTILGYMIGVVKILSNLPFSFLQSSGLIWLGVMVVYLGLFNLLIFKKHKK